MNALLFSCLHDNGLGTLGGYVIFGRKTEYRGVIETVIVLKQAA
jgi:hypothetical protein